MQDDASKAPRHPTASSPLLHSECRMGERISCLPHFTRNQTRRLNEVTKLVPSEFTGGLLIVSTPTPSCCYHVISKQPTMQPLLQVSELFGFRTPRSGEFAQFWPSSRTD